MVKMLEINENDMQTMIPKVVTFLQTYFDSVEGTYLKYESCGNEYFVNRNENRVVIMWEEEGEFLYTQFFIDENYDVTKMELSEFMVDITGEDLYFYQPDSCIEHSFYSDFKENDPIYNAVLIYTQWNKETDDRLCLSYDYVYTKNKVNLMYDYQIATPSTIQFDKNTSRLIKKGSRPFVSEKYILVKSVQDDMYYDKFSESSSSIDDDKVLKRYLRWYGKGEKPQILPFTKPLTREEMFERFEKMGFRTSIPNDVIETNNEGFVNLDEYYEIADILRRLDSVSNAVEQKMVLKPGDKNESN